MAPRIVLRIHRLIYVVRYPQAPLSPNPVMGLLQRTIPFAFRRRKRECDGRSVNLYATLPVPPAEILTVVGRAKWIDGPNGISYRLDGWHYCPSDNTYVAEVQCDSWQISDNDENATSKELIDRAVETEYLRVGFQPTYPTVEVLTYRSESPCKSAS